MVRGRMETSSCKRGAWVLRVRCVRGLSEPLRFPSSLPLSTPHPRTRDDHHDKRQHQPI